MLENIKPREDMRSLCRRKFKSSESQSVDPSLVDEKQKDGWQVVRKNKGSVKLERIKPHSRLLEDRVWSLLYRMGFHYLSGEGGASLKIDGEGGRQLSNQIDCIAIDGEIGLCVECKSSKEPGKRQNLQEEIAKLSALRKPLARGISEIAGDGRKRATVTCLFLHNAIITDNDLARAKESNVTILDDADLAYYEELVSHLGAAARYQFLADLLPGKEIPGLNIRVPAIRLRMAGGDAYMFAISPEFLLKVSYVSHRQKGKGSDIDTYQRMLRRARLRKIHEFIEAQGTFPTNIVVNIESRMLRFDRASQQSEGAGDTDSGILGWLEIRPTYKAAWIIDGQHRLFGYSGSTRAAKSRLTVLAFSGLKPSEQAGMFIDINSKQKSVKQSLLQELYAELHWDAAEPTMRVRAIISKAIQSLNADRTSPFHGRIQAADDGRDEKRCISLTSMFSALDRSDLYIANEKGGEVVEFGPLWDPDGKVALKRTVDTVNSWFRAAVAPVRDWWDIGSGEGGGLSMNDGVVALINVMRSVLSFMADHEKVKLVDLDSRELSELLRPYAEAVGDYLASLPPADRQGFRGYRGVQGVTTRQRRMQQAIKTAFPSYDPPGLAEFLKNEMAQTNKQARELLDEVELTLQSTVIEELQQEFGDSDTGWWFKGVPGTVRKDVSSRLEEDAGKRGGKEHYFNLIHYRTIIISNWDLFGKLLAYPKPGVGKEKGTDWIRELNEFRNQIMHVSSGVHISVDELDKIRQYHGWLKQRVEEPDEVPTDSEAEPIADAVGSGADNA